jgi:hypothetical protein
VVGQFEIKWLCRPTVIWIQLGSQTAKYTGRWAEVSFRGVHFLSAVESCYAARGTAFAMRAEEPVKSVHRDAWVWRMVFSTAGKAGAQ